MLDATEAILSEEGYGALTSRRVAERIEVKQRLVYYYFYTMDELIAETFRRLAARELERFNVALEAADSLRQVWDVCMNTTDTRLISEFMALANRDGELREEVKAYIEEARRIQVAALSRAMEGNPLEKTLAPVAAAIFATSAALTVNREAMLGIDFGHAEVTRAIAAVLDSLDHPH
jgi:AcrR family transcriptional regulator